MSSPAKPAEQNSDMDDSPSVLPPERYVRLFILDDNNTWSIVGTGYLYTSVVPRGTSSTASFSAFSVYAPSELLLTEPDTDMAIAVVSEESEQIILQTAVLPANCYTMQQSKLLLWWDATLKGKYALSFSTPVGCDQFLSLVKRYTDIRGPLFAKEMGLNETLQHPTTDQSNDSDSQTRELHTDQQKMFPDVLTFANISEVDNAMNSAFSEGARIHIFQNIVNLKYPSQLNKLFDDAEELEDKTTLACIGRMTRILLLLNSEDIWSEMFSSANMMGTLGALEYDPDLPPFSRLKHREKIKKEGVFQEVIKFDDESISNLIQRIFCLQYVRDNILMQFGDDQVLGSFLETIKTKQEILINKITASSHFKDDLLKSLKESEPGTKKREYAIRLLQDTLVQCKFLLPEKRDMLLDELLDADLLGIVASFFDDPVLIVRLTAAEVIGMLVDSSPSSSRQVIFFKDNAKVLGQLANSFLNEEDSGLISFLSDIFRALVNPELIEIEKMLEMTPFYKRTVECLFPQLLSPIPALLEKTDEDKTCTVIIKICEFFASCIELHPLFVNYFKEVQTFSLFSPFIIKFKSQITLAIIRFFKTIIKKVQSSWVIPQFCNDVVPKLFDVLAHEKSRNNMVVSSILDIFEMAAQTPDCSLILTCIAETHGEKLRSLVPSAFCKSILDAHEAQKKKVSFSDDFSHIYHYPEQDSVIGFHANGFLGDISGGPFAPFSLSSRQYRRKLTIAPEKRNKFRVVRVKRTSTGEDECIDATDYYMLAKARPFSFMDDTGLMEDDGGALGDGGDDEDDDMGTGSLNIRRDRMSLPQSIISQESLIRLFSDREERKEEQEEKELNMGYSRREPQKLDLFHSADSASPAGSQESSDQSGKDNQKSKQNSGPSFPFGLHQPPTFTIAEGDDDSSSDSSEGDKLETFTMSSATRRSAPDVSEAGKQQAEGTTSVEEPESKKSRNDFNSSPSSAFDMESQQRLIAGHAGVNDESKPSIVFVFKDNAPASETPHN